MVTIDELEEKFGIEGELGFYETDGEFISISIFNKYADAEICLYGGQVTRFMPVGAIEVLWMSQSSFFEGGKPIRGGIPLCFPWFGAHPSDASKPAHGFARLMNWDVLETASLDTSETKIILQLVSSELTKEYWPYDFIATLTIIVGRTLDVSLSIKNTSDETIEYTAALHSYFNVSGIENIRIAGLQGASYYNAFDNELFVQEEELLAIEKEENRRYIDTNSDCLLLDMPFNQIVRVSKRGANVTVVWNPGEEASSKMEDIANDGYQEFVCIEAVNAYNDSITLRPGEIHTTSTIIGVDQKASNLGLGEMSGGFAVI